MKLTLWQQFSSNHSASFMTVGKFKSIERAEEVAEELRSMLREIGAWWEQFPLDAQVHVHALDELIEQGKFTPEEKFREKYPDEWKENIHALDWIYNQNAADAVRRWNDLVIVAPKSDTWDGPKPFDLILRKLGGEVATECAIYDTYFAVNLTCKAPDDSTADKMMSEAKYIEPRPGLKLFIVSTFYPSTGKILRDGTQITYYHYQIHSSTPIYTRDPEKNIDVDTGKSILFEEQLQALIDYVRGHGCTDIQYSFVEAPYKEE